jgi:hypothetical protein
VTAIATPQDHLDDAVRQHTRRGWRLEHRTENQAQLVKGKHTSHLLHLVLSLITLGIWIPIWILVSLLGGQKQKFLSVDEYGTVRG